jgi:chloramphenicol 3-O-phosphotransferase
MLRALNALAGLTLVAVGLIHTFATWTVDGWTLLAVVGVVMVGVDLCIEEREADRGR